LYYAAGITLGVGLTGPFEFEFEFEFEYHIFETSLRRHGRNK